MLQSAKSRLYAAWIEIQNAVDRYHTQIVIEKSFGLSGQQKFPGKLILPMPSLKFPEGMGAGEREDRGRALPLFVPREIQRVRGTNPGCHANGRKADCGDGRGRTLATDSGQTLDR